MRRLGVVVRRFRTSMALAALLAWVPATGAQPTVGTAFTYQGRLTDAGAPANGSYALQFKLFTAATGGTSFGLPVQFFDVTVSGGLFTVTLDFGPGAFTGEPRWLEIAARPGGPTGDFTVLTPRQELTPTPNGMFAQAVPWAGIIGTPVDLVTGVASGGGITGSITANTLTLGSDSTVQRRTAGSPLNCAGGQYLQAVTADGTPTCVADATGWGLSGNAGTNPLTNNFIGTTDDAALEFKVNNLRALRLVPNATSPNVIGGFSGNSVLTGVVGAVIGGGGYGSDPNSVTANFGFVGGGATNRASGLASAVLGGSSNTASGPYSTLGGGQANTASGDRSTVGGGQDNTASGDRSTVGGGENNTASGFLATVVGGAANTASGSIATVAGGGSNLAGGTYSFAAGQDARVRNASMVGGGDLDGDENTFVWSDGLGGLQSTGPKQFLIKSAGGVGINKNNPAPGALDVNGDVIATGVIRTARRVEVLDNSTGPGIFDPNTLALNQLVLGRVAAASGFEATGLCSGGATAVGKVCMGANGGTWYWGSQVSPTTMNVTMALGGNGDLSVVGNLSKGGGSFKIDHPLDPENKYLYHSFVESPDMKNIYDGVVTSDAEGFAVVELPTWFEALNRDFRYQLTVIGDGAWARARVYKKIECGRFTIQTDLPRVEVSWLVTGIRQDAFAERNRIPVEQEKPANERGTLLYPEAHGKPAASPQGVRQ